MAYRELRNFTEMMRALGYARPISVENFKTPNFDLVADALRWLVLRYEPNGDLGKEIGTMQDRVIFLKQAASIMLAKGRIKLNTKRLYQADGFAVKELLKIAQVLYNAMRSNPEEDEDLLVSDNFSLKLNDLKDVRDLAAEITEHGATLAELLAKEDTMRDARQRAVSRNAEMSEIETMIRQNIKAAESNKANKVKLIEELEQDRALLEKKKEKKAQELERNKKRYKSLVTVPSPPPLPLPPPRFCIDDKSIPAETCSCCGLNTRDTRAQVRPAFMDEYEKLEDELQVSPPRGEGRGVSD